MNRPITSPWPAVLTSSPTITFGATRPRARAASSAPGDLIVVGDRDRAESLLARCREQHLDRCRAVARVIGVHVQVDLDQRPRASPSAIAGSPRRACARRGARRRSPRISSARRPRSRTSVIPGPERARHQLRGRGQARGARVEAPEEALHEAPREQRREQAFAGGVKGADVQRARVPQRSVGGPRRERLVHVHEVELHRGEHFLHGARHVDRRAPRGAGVRRPRRRAPRPPRSRAARPGRSLQQRLAAPPRRAGPCASRARAPASARARAPARGVRARTAARSPGARAR